MTNLSPQITEKIGRNLHNQAHHPICKLKDRIYQVFRGFSKINFDPVVPVETNFDSLLVPKDHLSRNPSESYYVDEQYCLRTHILAHQFDLLSEGYPSFLVTGDVYRKDVIDKIHHSVFHQIGG